MLIMKLLKRDTDSLVLEMQCKDVNKNGKSNGRQRYICKRCRTSFDEFTMSPFSNTKLGSAS